MSPAVKPQPLALSAFCPFSFLSQFQLLLLHKVPIQTTYNLPIVPTDHHCNSSCILFSLPGKKLSKRECGTKSFLAIDELMLVQAVF